MHWISYDLRRAMNVSKQCAFQVCLCGHVLGPWRREWDRAGKQLGIAVESSDALQRRKSKPQNSPLLVMIADVTDNNSTICPCRDSSKCEHGRKRRTNIHKTGNADWIYLPLYMMNIHPGTGKKRKRRCLGITLSMPLFADTASPNGQS
uniref:Uncharacterized protein n=1 Tax=Rousettus aegyptiacus TaxID=9407 RepID=A0A7J8DXF6_ROUAE|nr:hypothetical protein HJG63_008371 [Rousettus aegyptiacus]